jgi:hypothetical protein
VADGTYVLVMERPIFPGNPQGIRIAPFVSREGFEYRQSLIPYNLAPTLSWSPGMQRVLNLEAGATLTATVYPEEGYGGVEDGCDSCKVVRVSVPHAGDLTLSLKADDERLRLVLPNNHTPGEPFGVRGGDTVTVLVTQAMTPTEFHLTTTLSTPVSAR